MPLLPPTSSFKTTATIVIAGVLTVASVSHFVISRFPIIYDNTVFLLKPPYLYLVINFIIVSIVATSKLTHKSTSVDDSDISEPIPVPSDIDTGYLNVVHVTSDYTGFVEKFDVRDDPPVDLTVEDVLEFPEVIVDGEKPKNDSPEISILKLTRKPPRFNQQKSLKTSSEGGNKKSALGVTKPPRRQDDTLETTWKKITEGRSTPLTKHLTKSDSWHVQTSSEKKEKIAKSDNLNDRNAPAEEKTHLKREASPGQEELNRRVEAFIKKFNEDMRLQRLESLAKYNEMVVNGGTRL